MLERSGATEVFVVSPKDYEGLLQHFLPTLRFEMKIELVAVDELNGSADGLRAVYERIRGDFIVLNSDILSEFSLGPLVDLHRTRTSDLTMLLATLPADEVDKKGQKKKLEIDKEDQEYIGAFRFLCISNYYIMPCISINMHDVVYILFVCIYKNLLSINIFC